MHQREITEHLIRQFFVHNPTKDQAVAISHLAAFAVSNKNNPLYLLKGYAGTGKTSLIGAFVKMLTAEKKRFVLMAPTGRAAKVLSKYTGRFASTIHRRIYLFVTGSDGITRMIKGKNRLENTFFIIDESSMIGDGSTNDGTYVSQNNLLDDLMDYVFSGSGNKLLLVGDTAQLPPVGMDLSPALDLEFLKASYDVTAYSFEMKEVMRQALDSAILYAATLLRKKIEQNSFEPPFFFKKTFNKDIEIIDSADLFEEYLQQAFYGDGDDDKSIIVCRTNKRANLFNKQVRQRILQRENILEAGDKIMIVKNNYYWLDNDSSVGFLANGDIAEVVRVVKTENMYGFDFAEAEIRLVDYPQVKEINVKLLLDTLDLETPALPKEKQNLLFETVMEDYSGIPSYKKRVASVQKNPYYNALQIKFAYAMTCHKTQGGQWPYVFIDQGYLNDDMLNKEFLRWLYTALTRSTSKVYLVNFNPEFFG